MIVPVYTKIEGSFTFLLKCILKAQLIDLLVLELTTKVNREDWDKPAHLVKSFAVCTNNIELEEPVL